MSKGKAGGMLGVGGTRSHLSRNQLRGGRGGKRQDTTPRDPMAQKRELLRRLRESHGDGRADSDDAAEHAQDAQDAQDAEDRAGG